MLTYNGTIWSCATSIDSSRTSKPSCLPNDRLLRRGGHLRIRPHLQRDILEFGQPHRQLPPEKPSPAPVPPPPPAPPLTTPGTSSPSTGPAGPPPPTSQQRQPKRHILSHLQLLRRWKRLRQHRCHLRLSHPRVGHLRRRRRLPCGRHHTCTSATFCVAVGASGYATIYNGSSWSDPRGTSRTGRTIDAVSCFSSSFCVAVDTTGYATIYNGTSWSTLPISTDPDRKQRGTCTSTSLSSLWWPPVTPPPTTAAPGPPPQTWTPAGEHGRLIMHKLHVISSSRWMSLRVRRQIHRQLGHPDRYRLHPQHRHRHLPKHQPMRGGRRLWIRLRLQRQRPRTPPVTSTPHVRQSSGLPQ